MSRARCDAKTRAGTPCRFVAGFKTDHVGQGRCHLHGGLTPTKTGRYSTITRPRIAALIAQYNADPAPLDTSAEIALVRALLVDYIERYDQFTEALIAWHEDTQRETAKPHQVLDVADAYRMAGEVTKMVERVEKAQAASAVSLPELERLMLAMGRVVEYHVPDVAIRAKISEAWLALHV